MDLFRIRASLWMMAATVVACIGMVIYGKHLRRSGDSLQRRGEIQIAEWQEQGRQERAAAAAAAAEKQSQAKSDI